MKILVEAKHLSFYYHNNIILENITFTQKAQESIAFLGLSGSGKTTLLKTVANILKPTKGSITVYTHKVAYVSQESGLLPWLTVIDNVLLRESLSGDTKDILLAKECLNKVGLSDYELNYPYQLSVGMQKRVELARAFLSKPELLLLDEPFAALDFLNQEKLSILTKEMCRQHGTTLMLVTHSLDEAFFLADTVMGLAGTPSSIAVVRSVNQKNRNHRLAQDVGGDLSIIKGELRGFFSRTTECKNRVDHSVRKKKSWLQFFLLPMLIALMSILLLFSGLKFLFNWPDYLFPYPKEVIKVWLRSIYTKMIFVHLKSTIEVALMGFSLALVIAVPIGYFFSKHQLLRSYGMPIILVINTIPTVAIAPFVVLWFGFGLFSKILIVFFIVWLPLVIGSYQAFRVSMQQVRDYIYFFKPTWWRTFVFLELPASMAYLFASIKISIALSIVGSVVGEFIAGTKGLGSLMNIARANFNTPLMFTSLIWLMILGIIFYLGTSISERWFLRKHLGYLHMIEK